MPYVVCPKCSARTYAPRSYLAEAQFCPACETELDAGALLPLAIRPPLAGLAARSGGRELGEAIPEDDGADARKLLDSAA